LLRKEIGNVKARRILSAILRVFRVAPVDHDVLQEALQLPASDFEDAVTAASARSAGCECIVARDPKGFRGPPVRSLTAEAVTPRLSGNEPFVWAEPAKHS
jgi:predicted nucleic acid-binding protein